MEIKTEKLSLRNKLDELNTINEFLDALAESWELETAFIMSMNLVLEEAFTNIVNYAYDDDLSHTIIIDFGKLNGNFTIEITDDGKAYDPTLAAEPDIQLPAEARGIGGLGIFLIRKMMDEVQYTRTEGKNILKLKKKLTSSL